MFEKEIKTKTKVIEIIPKYGSLGFIKVSKNGSRQFHTYDLMTLNDGLSINIEGLTEVYGSISSLPDKKEFGVYVKIDGEKDINIDNESNFYLSISKIV